MSRFHKGQPWILVAALAGFSGGLLVHMTYTAFISSRTGLSPQQIGNSGVYLPQTLRPAEGSAPAPAHIPLPAPAAQAQAPDSEKAELLEKVRTISQDYQSEHPPKRFEAAIKALNLIRSKENQYHDLEHDPDVHRAEIEAKFVLDSAPKSADSGAMPGSPSAHGPGSSAPITR